jgi:hypothetical protein
MKIKAPSLALLIALIGGPVVACFTTSCMTPADRSQVRQETRVENRVEHRQDRRRGW